MKQLTALQQQGRRSSSLRGSNAPSQLDAAADGAIKSPATIFWLIIHGLCCLISLLLGFRFSRLVFFLLFSTPSTTIYSALQTTLPSSAAAKPPPNTNISAAADGGSGGGSRVVVGRHGILIRPWPHPDPAEVMKAHGIIARVQAEQRSQYGVKSPKTVIAVTPTYVRTFQTLHLTGVMHSLMNVPYDLIWIVIEVGPTTNETASLIAKSGLKTIHIGFNSKTPLLWEDRHKLESRMRLHALRVIREKRLDGIVMFADDSNTHSLELFDEIQNVKWLGAFPIGIIAQYLENSDEEELPVVQRNEKKKQSSQLPIQGPICNSTKHFVGWQTFNTVPFVERSARYVGDRAAVLPREVEWAAFVLNSRLVWDDEEMDNTNKPVWVKEWEEIVSDGDEVESPLDFLKDRSVVEPLAGCGRKVLLWWLRAEARADSKFPPRWIIDPPLEITVQAKRTPWPDAPPELPSSDEKVFIRPEITERRPTKNGSRRKRSSRSKKKQRAKVIDEHVFTQN